MGKKRKNPEFKLHSGCVKWLREEHPETLTVHADATGGGAWAGAFFFLIKKND